MKNAINATRSRRSQPDRRALRQLIPFGFALAIGLAACTVPKRGPSTAPSAGLLTEVRDHTGAPVAKDALRGHWSVLWFYPKAQTSG